MASILPSPEIELPNEPTICGDTCAFRLCRRNADKAPNSIGRSMLINAASIPVICNPRLGSISLVNTGKPQIYTPTGYVNLQQYLLNEGLGDVGEKAFTDESLFKQIDGRFGRDQGISSSFNAEQYSALKDRCIVLPVVSFRSDIDGLVERRNSPLSDCVSFRAKAPKMHVEYVWTFASDDFDLQVTTPSGAVINTENKRGGKGRLVKNIGAQKCRFITHARESIVFNDAFDAGKYVIRITNSGRCPRLPGKNPFALYAVRVFVDGQVIFRTAGRAIGKTFQEDYDFTA